MKNVLPVNSSIKGPEDIFNKIVKKKEDYFSLNSNLENCKIFTIFPVFLFLILI